MQIRMRLKNTLQVHHTIQVLMIYMLDHACIVEMLS
jgi:hypothetical protein